MNQQVLLINDLAGYGKVALSAMIPIMSYMGINIQNLPTALVSNTLDYGKFDILDTTDYMKNTLKVWHELGFKFDAVATGFICNETQAKIINEYCHHASSNGALILCDPIMGDEGQLYPGMDQTCVDNMAKIVACADYIVPNFTEATFLTNHPYSVTPSNEEIKDIIDDLRKMGAKSVVITSVVQNDKFMVCCYDNKLDEYFDLEYQNIPVRIPGTGDIFSSSLLGSLLNGATLKDSVAKAMKIVEKMIELNMHNQDLYKGIEIESCLKEIDHA